MSQHQTNINHDDLEGWATRAAQELQEFCDDAQEAAGNPDGEDQLPGVRGLIRELDAILKGEPLWQMQVRSADSDTELVL